MAEQQANKTSFLPDFCNVRMVFVIILLAELLAIILALAQPAYVQDRLFSLALYSVFIQCISITCAAALCFSRVWLNSLSDQWAATLAFLLILLISLVFVEISWWMFSRWAVVDPSHGAHWGFVLRSMGITGISAALVLRYFYVQHQWRRNVQLESSSRLDALQARIRPHFLFNCMNTIASLTRRDAMKAEQAVEDLADLFRASLQDSLKLTTLADELALCRRYVNIESLRLGDRLRVQWQTEDLPPETRIPGLSLQPLLENAIYHGIEPRTGGGEIVIRGTCSGNEVQIEISNPTAVTTAPAHASGNQLAQDNIRQRLAAIYNRKASMSIREEQDRYTVTLTLPRDFHEDTDR